MSVQIYKINITEQRLVLYTVTTINTFEQSNTTAESLMKY